jgi:heme/copper-type cytochrome/quinol oxidase subunit 2
MVYALLGKFFICILVFLVVWFGLVFRASKHKDPDGGNIMAAFWIVGPVAGIVAAVACWFFLLP